CASALADTSASTTRQKTRHTKSLKFRILFTPQKISSQFHTSGPRLQTPKSRPSARRTRARRFLAFRKTAMNWRRRAVVETARSSFLNLAQPRVARGDEDGEQEDDEAADRERVAGAEVVCTPAR